MKYAIFFSCLFSVLVFVIATGTQPVCYILIWPAINMLLFAIAYKVKQPYLLCGKRSDGALNIILLLLNLPWLSFSWLVWCIEKVLSKENEVDQIDGTNWFISKYPGISYPSEDYELIVDLTAEFPRAKNAGDNYICFPNLDGVEINNLPVQLDVGIDAKVLVHCAQGHGRSATWTSIALAKLGHFSSALDAYHVILSSRSKAKVSSSQLKQLHVKNNATQ